MPVPHLTDESNTNPLPDPELNPLLNPLLAAHMGRWAEVYFTNPPEKREEAIAELIRELQSLAPQEVAPVQAIHDDEARKKPLANVPEISLDAVETFPTCDACGYNNSAGQRFCGMCGLPLQVATESRVPQVVPAAPIVGESRQDAAPSDNSAGEMFAAGPTDFGRDRNAPALTLPSLQASLPDFDLEAGPPPYRYQLYAGVALVVLVVLLVYMVWRGTKAISGAAGPPAAPSRVSAPARAEAAPQQGAAQSAPPGGNVPASAGQRNGRPTPSRKARHADTRPASRLVTNAAISASTAAEPSGAEDLATAENYLNGTQGGTRDSKEAALWLWKAVGKGNPAATLALSDLYLRGDGVPKSCDQARLLLDAAARKGARAAGERLRNLRAFGCE
jgi:hypothetical protein